MIRYINVLHIFDKEGDSIENQLIESDKYLFLAWVHDILIRTDASKEQANQLGTDGFKVIISRRDHDRKISDFEEYRSEPGYRIIKYMLGRDNYITGSKLEAIACLSWCTTRINVLHDLPFTPESAERVMSIINEWGYSDRPWCLLLGKPNRKFLSKREGFHFGIVNGTYLQEGLLDTNMDILTKSSQYNLDGVFELLIKSTKKHGWQEHYIDVL